MNNIYDIRSEKNLYFILDKCAVDHHVSNQMKEKTAIAVYIYYPESADQFMRYLRGIPTQIAVYLISPSEKVKQMYDEYIRGRENTFFIKKENRGRDISALLVTLREVVCQYSYFCFIHDKKEKSTLISEDTKLWMENMWENSIASAAYIDNVLDTFSRNENIGLLTIPEPMGSYINACYSDNWGKNYANTSALAQKMHLICNIDIDKPPITLGTVFWCRVNALEKLFKQEWSYDDFPEEPLANDGMINHAVERILGYVAQDAGYETGTMMTNAYAAKYMSFLQSGYQQTFLFLRELTGIRRRKELDNYEENRERIRSFFQKNSTVYLYGAGVRGKDCIVFCRNIGCIPAGVLTTEKTDSKIELEGIDVIPIAEAKNLDTAGIIISANYNQQKSIMAELQKRNITNYICYTDIID